MSLALTQRFAAATITAGTFATLLLSGCGAQYRPVVTSTNPVGPAQQPTKYAIAISQPTSSTQGLLTFVDVSGDTILSTPQIQQNPNYIALNAGGGTGFTINTDGVLDIFSAGSPTTLITSEILTTNLQAAAAPVSIAPITLTGSSASLFIPQPGLNSVAALSSSGALLQQIAVGTAPTYVVGTSGASRAYVLNSGNTVSALESSSAGNLSVSSTITVGTNPVYGVMTSDAKRAFILNKGSQSVSVINVINNALDTGVTGGTISLPTVTDSGGNNLSSNPVWADLNPLTNELVVLSQGDGTHQGLLSIINIPLCSAVVQPTNPNCDSTNPVDATGFGTVVLQTPVGINPTMVSMLRDTILPRAYVANSGNSSSNGSVSVVNILSGVETARLATVADGGSTSLIYGLHPSTIAAEDGTPKGKVYVTSPDSSYLSVIYTDTDNVALQLPLYGPGTKVVLTSE